MADVMSAIHAERNALAEDLEGLNDAQWSSPSLCSDWTVRDVVAHMTATAKISPPQFFVKFIGSGFSLKRLQNKDIAVERGASPADTLSRFKAEVNSTKHPPGPNESWLGEAVIHSEDVRRALGLKHEYPVEDVVRVADFYKGSNLIVGAKKRVSGLKLQATDTDWSTGDGPEVAGPILSLVMAMTGRKDVLSDLSGPGVATLQSRS